MASPNPAGSESRDKTSRVNAAAAENQTQTNRKTQPLSARICKSDTDNPDEYCQYTEEKFPVTKLVVSIVLTVATIGAFVSAAIYAHFAHQQVTESQHLAESAHDQVVEAVNANAIAKNAVGRADARAKEANQIARDTLASSERAWVGTGPIDILAKPAEGQPLTIRVGILNGGKSPAVHVQVTALLNGWVYPKDDQRVPFIKELPQCRRDKPKWDDTTGGSSVLPGVTNMNLDLKSPALNKTQLDLLLNPTHTIFGGEWSIAMKDVPRASASPDTQSWSFGVFFVGCVNYFDEFHNARRSSFCQFYGLSDYAPNGAFYACPKGNAAD